MKYAISVLERELRDNLDMLGWIPLGCTYQSELVDSVEELRYAIKLLKDDADC